MGIGALIITLAVCLTMTVFIIKKPTLSVGFLKFSGKPLKLDSYFVIALIAPVALLIGGFVTFSDIFKGFTADGEMNPLKILILFLSMCFMSVCLDKAGFFEYCALKTLSVAKNGQKTLFTYFYFFIALLTVFTSNDIIILAFTPFICYFCKSAKISALPYIAAEFAAANTWSIMLIIGNPTNIYIASSLGITFLEYLNVMALPAVAAGLTSYFTIRIIFSKKLEEKAFLENASPLEMRIKDKPAAIVSLILLALCVVFMSVGNYIKLQMWLISLIFAALLLVSLIILHAARVIKGRKEGRLQPCAKPKSVILPSLGGLPYPVIPFLLSISVAIIALQKHGVTDSIAQALFGLTENKGTTVYIFGFLSSLMSNVLNNIPMSVLFTGIIQAGNGALANYAAYATIIGSNIGAFISPAGALAGIMLLNIIKDKDTGFTNLSFVKYLAPAALFSLITSLAVLVLTLSLFG